MEKAVPYLLVIVVLGVLLAVSMRNQRRKAAAQAERAGSLAAGSQVMTTSGLYGTVTAQNGDGTVLLQIADGVVVRWAVAALRDADTLPDAYRGPLQNPAAGEADEGDAPKP